MIIANIGSQGGEDLITAEGGKIFIVDKEVTEQAFLSFITKIYCSFTNEGKVFAEDLMDKHYPEVRKKDAAPVTPVDPAKLMSEMVTKVTEAIRSQPINVNVNVEMKDGRKQVETIKRNEDGSLSVNYKKDEEEGHGAES